MRLRSGVRAPHVLQCFVDAADSDDSDGTLASARPPYFAHKIEGGRLRRPRQRYVLLCCRVGGVVGWCYVLPCFVNVAMFRDDSAAESYRSLRSRGVAASHFCRRFATPTTPTTPLFRFKQVRWVCSFWLRCSKPPCCVHDHDRFPSWGGASSFRFEDTWPAAKRCRMRRY